LSVASGFVARWVVWAARVYVLPHVRRASCRFRSLLVTIEAGDFGRIGMTRSGLTGLEHPGRWSAPSRPGLSSRSMNDAEAGWADGGRRGSGGRARRPGRGPVPAGPAAAVRPGGCAVASAIASRTGDPVGGGGCTAAAPPGAARRAVVRVV